MGKVWEFRWHGRGGQGIVTATRLFAEAAHIHAGFAGVTATPSFGAERRGAPVAASTRISDAPIVLRSQVVKADILIIFDPTLLSGTRWLDQLKPGAAVVVNAPSMEGISIHFEGVRLLVQVDASHIAMEEGMVSAGSPLVSAAMLGALTRAFPEVSLSSIQACLQNRFPGPSGERNVSMAAKGFERAQTQETK